MGSTQGGGMLTFQDLQEHVGDPDFLLEVVGRHVGSRDYRIAKDADLYDRQRNRTVNEYVQRIFDLSGSKLVDFTASNNKIASNFFHRLNTQRCMYSLGNGVSFVNPGGSDATDSSGVDTTKERLGRSFDHDIKEAAYFALIHGVSFVFWNLDRTHVFKMTEFAPLWDEYDGSLRAGIRFWRLDRNRPMTLVLYEEDGYTKYVTDGPDDGGIHVVEEKRPYKQNIEHTEAGGDEVVGYENYGSLPIVPMWGSSLKQSTLVGMRQAIDSYDLIKSGFANDLTDCSEIYWLVSNAGGMTDEDLSRFRDRLKFMHIANVDSDSGESVTPYTQEIPHAARKEYLDMIRAGIYEDFGALDVHTVAAGATNDHIDAAYQPMDENAADFEYQVSECIRKILELQGIDDTPVFTRNRISNQREQVEMVAMEAQWLDEETILRKLPNIRPEEVVEILSRSDSEDQGRLISGFMESGGE